MSDLDIHINCHGVNFVKPPVNNLFSKFNTYIYTPTPKTFDCSPRLIAECKYYNKQVVYHNITAEYLKKDKGLNYRINDIESGLHNITLTDDDDIFNILNERI